MLKTFYPIFLVFILAVNSVKQYKSLTEDGNDVFEFSIKPQVVKYDVSSGSNLIKLQCNVQQNFVKKNRILSINELRWEHKKCGYGLNLTSCANFTILPWTPVMCKNGSKLCDGYTLKLENPKATDSGYYQCLCRNYLSKQFKTYRVFHVDIYDPEASFEILNEPLQYDRYIMHVNDTITFRCRARSLFPLHMIWVKLVTDDQQVNRSFHYGMNTYELIKNDGFYYIGNDLYISKLTLNNSQISDSGKYYCIVINVNNVQMIKNKTVSLRIVPRIQSTSNFPKPGYIQLTLVWIYFLIFFSRINL